MILSIWWDAANEEGYRLMPHEIMRFGLVLQGTSKSYDFASGQWTENPAQPLANMVRQSSFSLSQHWTAVVDVPPPPGSGVVHAAIYHPTIGVVDSYPASVVRGQSDRPGGGANITFHVSGG